MVPPRPIKACTNCRQQKIRCNAAQTYPDPCTRCAKYDRPCMVDPLFKPRRGGQIELLRQDIRRLERQMSSMKPTGASDTESNTSMSGQYPLDPQDAISGVNGDEQATLPSKDGPAVFSVGSISDQSDSPTLPSTNIPIQPLMEREDVAGHLAEAQANASIVIIPTKGPYELENVKLTSDEAQRLHDIFMRFYWPFLPIFESDGAGELYSQSETLFWTVMCMASMSDPEPDLYLSVVDPLKRLVMKVCWVETPRSTHIVQALLILSTWPLPNEKVLDDPSQRYTSLARSLGLQLGMHRGKFIYEFSRKQKLMPNAVKWRTRTWIYTYICEQFLSASLGIPSNMPVDYIIENSPHNPDMMLSNSSRCILKLAAFYSKMVNIMGSSVSSPDGLIDAKSRCPTLDILNHDLHAVIRPNEFENDKFVEIVYLYVQCILCTFAFLPGTPEEDQSRFIVRVFHAATRLVTIMRNFVGKRRILEFPGFVRQASSFAALVLFRLHLLPHFPKQFVESARESVVTVHHLYRNVSPAWATVQNDVSRIAKILESLNYVLITHPYLLESRQIIKRMRSHLTFSLFYELLWTVHEARRRNTKAKEKVRKGTAAANLPQPLIEPETRSTESLQNMNVRPLPLFSRISTDAYTSSTVVSPNGTTLTKLLPTSSSQLNLIDVGNAGDGLNAEALTPQNSHRSTEPSQLGIKAELPFNSVNSTKRSTPDGQLAIDELMQGFDWMDYEGDDFLGWMPNAELGL